MGFVDKLFECLSTKNYLGLPAPKEPPKEEVKPAAVKSDIVEVIQKKTVYAALLRFLTPSLLFPLQFIFVLVNLPEHCFVCRLKLQRRSERTGGGEVLWETALTLTSPGTTAALAASHFCAVFSMEGLWPLTASKHPLFCTYLLLVWWAPRCPGAWPWIIAVDAYIWSNFIGFKLRAFFCFL